jgi:hypothetical protein
VDWRPRSDQCSAWSEAFEVLEPDFPFSGLIGRQAEIHQTQGIRDHFMKFRLPDTRSKIS